MEPTRLLPDPDATIRMSPEEIRLRMRSLPGVEIPHNEPMHSNSKILPASAPNTITIENNEDIIKRKTMVTIHQLLDLKEGQEFIERIKSEASRGQLNWVIKLTEISYCDSMTFGFFYIWYSICNQFGGSMVFSVRRDSSIQNLFEQSRLSEICNVDLV